MFLDKIALPPRNRKPSVGALCLAIAALVCLASSGVGAQEIPVDLELVLAADVSASIDSDEAHLQRAGYIAALTDASVIDAIRGGIFGRIAVIYIEWAGVQHTAVDWTIIEDATSAQAFANLLRKAPLTSGADTSISGALDYAAELFVHNGLKGTRQVIDISSDGRNYSGRPLGFARADALADGITINALPLLRYDDAGHELNPDLDRYFNEQVIGGPGAFMVPVLGLDAFPAAIRKKLIIEISGAEVPERRQSGVRALAARDPTGRQLGARQATRPIYLKTISGRIVTIPGKM